MNELDKDEFKDIILKAAQNMLSPDGYDSMQEFMEDMDLLADEDNDVAVDVVINELVKDFADDLYYAGICNHIKFDDVTDDDLYSELEDKRNFIIETLADYASNQLEEYSDDYDSDDYE